MNISLDKLATPVAFAVIGFVMVIIGATGTVPVGNPQPVIHEPILRIVLGIVGVILLLVIGPVLVWRETTTSKDVKPYKEKLSSLVRFCTEVKVRTENAKNEAHGQRSLAERINILVKDELPNLPQHIEPEKWRRMREMVESQHSRSYVLLDELEKLYEYVCDYCSKPEGGQANGNT